MDRPNDPLTRRLARDAASVPARPSPDLTERVLASLPDRAPRAPAARRHRPLLPVLGLAAAALATLWALGLGDRDGPTGSIGGDPAAAFAPKVPEPRWLDAPWPVAGAPSLPAVAAPPGPSGPVSLPARLFLVRPIDPLVAVERSVTAGVDAAARRAGAQAAAILSAAAAPLLRLHGALTGSDVPH